MMRSKKKGFTLIELLAVIVILGLLIAIAIPSITRYITESRKKTLATTIGNYIGAVLNEVNDFEYTFTGDNTIYALPIECVSLERGGTNPFGEWYQANSEYFAYVFIQYDDKNESYTYGFTFKDSAGYGLYPIAQEKLNVNGKQIRTDLQVNQPKTGKVTTVTSLDIWDKSGFKVNATTNLVVLEAASEGVLGDNVYTCTLLQKGNNYDEVSGPGSNNDNVFPDGSFANLILKNNRVISKIPNLYETSSKTDEKGLYRSNDTNGEKATYYFRGNVNNNYVSFAGFIWRIIRINEDGTVRLILEDGIYDNSLYLFNNNANDISSLYYSNSNAKIILDDWYLNNLFGYDSYISISNFCEQAKVKVGYEYTSGNVNMNFHKHYIPNFRCEKDDNGKGILNLKLGLISIDEMIYAGGDFFETNDNFYLNNSNYFWTMSAAGNYLSKSYVWSIYPGGKVHNFNVADDSLTLRPVINLNVNVKVSGNGLSNNMYIVM